MKITRKIIHIDEELCNGCGQCVPACAEGTLEIIDGKAKVVSDNLCDGLGACLGECPTGALSMEEREAEEFDEAAVEKRLAGLETKAPAPAAMACGCPSTQVMSFGAGNSDRAPAHAAPSASELTHWPVKIRLVPATAPFLKNADLLILADCAAAACPNLHPDLIRGRVVMMGCPKFDDVDIYLDKIEQICRNGGIRSLTTVIMEVPCCSGLHTIVRKSRDASGMKIPLTEIIIDRRGNIIEKRGGISATHLPGPPPGSAPSVS
jgi:NAD-dependent dihydropyrimidine dehydrogenase PreA subunit